ncbi:winged helix-turn-helix domain-containing protein [Nocardiopsis sp. NPDC049922]|uniref:winged helix-turn-helix domain-containing protein n=1 Tax=Nocardiopsis sp. NPDC049922 TaxID=3155157 RepID=UPI0033D0D41F
MTTTTTARRPKTRTRELILTALAEAPESVTVTELAEVAGVGRSTLGKHLPSLEKDGLAVRTPGGRDGRRRLPDTWQATTSTESDTTDSEDTFPARAGGEEPVDAVPAEPEAVVDTASAPVAPVLEARAEDSVPTARTEENLVEETPDEEVATTTSRTPDVPAQPAPAPATPPKPRAASPRTHVTTTPDVNPVSGSTRLAPGELKLMVRAILDSDPGEEFTATEISHLLQGRSIGAIQNNLARLAKDGYAVRTCEKPRRYRSAKAAS